MAVADRAGITSGQQNPRLRIVHNLIADLDKHDIKYCHWKSNINLEKGCAGQTDLDLLVHKKDREKFNIVLRELNFKRIMSPPLKQLPGMEDYLGFDSETGKLCHLHVHYKLILGQKYIKNHHLPVEQFVFNKLKLFKNIYTPAPEVELLLLIIRANLKFDFYDYLALLVRKRNYIFPEDVYNEFKFLIKEYDRNIFSDIVTKSTLPLSVSVLTSFLDKIENSDLSVRDVLSIRKYLLNSLRQYQQNKYILCLHKHILFYLLTLPIINRIFPSIKKRIPGRGRFFAIVGADGSGKTTLVKDLTKWLSWKMQVRTLYFGIPKTLSLKMVNKLISLLRFPVKIGLKKPFAPVVNLGHYVSVRRWIWIAGKRLRIYRKAFEWTKKGMIVISDRYPLAEFRNMASPMDGPRIQKEWGSESGKLAHLEQHYYSQIRLPDKVFVLKTDINELRKRKKDLDFHSHQEKADTVNSIKESFHIAIINANRAYPVVLKELKQRIWAMI